MKRNRIFLSVLSGAVALGAASVFAHHSASMFDHAKTLTINGEVVELRWVNPHVSLSVKGAVKELPEDGTALWVMELIAAALEKLPVSAKSQKTLSVSMYIAGVVLRYKRP